MALSVGPLSTSRRGQARRRGDLPLWTLLAVAALLVALQPPELACQTRRALLIGINSYERFARPVSDSSRALIGSLDGSVNDAEAMRDLLRARFGFPAEHIVLLEDTAATRERILRAIRQLVDAAEPGDIVVFFYAGHGSQRRNSRSKRPTKLDQTIVPVDANTGIYDIRDKELAQLFGPLADKGAVVTLIFDSCHSGAMARGVAVTYKERWAAVDPRDAADSVTPPAPADRGALVISSAQDYETAGEMRDDANVAHGVFTSALLAVLRTSAPDEPASRIFQRVKAIMQSSGRAQEPVLDATMARRQQPFLGGAAAIEGVTTVAVLRFGGPGEVELQGGPAIGLRDSAELIAVERGAGTRDVRLKVTKVLGLSHSIAAVVAGSRDSVHPGDLFQIEKWAPAPAAGLRVWIPSAAPDSAVVEEAIAAARELRSAPGGQWVDDPALVPADSTPLAVLGWRDGAWVLEVPDRPVVRLSRPLNARAVERELGQHQHRVRLCLLVPPSPQLVAHLDLGRGTPHDLVGIVADRGEAQYLLVGRVSEGRIEYAWLRPNASQEMARSSTLPIRTDWVAGDTTTARRLGDQALRLAAVRSWLELESPPDQGRFPYHLALRVPATGALKTEGPVYDGDGYGLVLHADPGQLTPQLVRRRVYVFVIDSYGRSTLLFPLSNVLNRLPYEQSATGTWPAEIPLGGDTVVTVVPPFGMDTYVLLTSDEVVPTEALDWAGVRSRGPGEGSALGSLLFAASSGARGGAPATVPMNWSIERMPVLSAPKAATGAK